MAGTTAGVGTGLKGYLQAVGRFSFNARLYMLHIVGMDVVSGTWAVLFNLYLLYVGFSPSFIALRLSIQTVAYMIATIPGGWLSDKIGRKWSFILGDGMGAALALIQIATTSRFLLLTLPALGAIFGVLHGVSEPAFMAENSEPAERVHLFSVGSGLGTLADMAGSLVAGFVPVLAAGLGSTADKIAIYRYATYAGIIWWFLSLIPAWLLREHKGAAPAAPAAGNAPKPGLWARLWNVQNPVTVLKLVAVHAVLYLGAGMVPLMNVFFHEHLHAGEQEIGTTFATGSFFLAIGALLAPLVVERLGKVRTIVWTRLAAVPFILLLAYSATIRVETHGDLTEVHVLGLQPAFTLAGLAYVLRIVLQNLSGPVYDAMSMDLLAPAERATYISARMLVGNGLQAIGFAVYGWLMNRGDYRTPFLIMAIAYLVSAMLFWAFFRRSDRPAPAAVAAASGD